MMPDPIAPIAAAAIEHMNSDHADAVLAYARGLAGIAWAKQALITRLEAGGIEIQVSGDERTTSVLIPFEPPLTPPGTASTGTHCSGPESTSPSGSRRSGRGSSADTQC